MMKDIPAEVMLANNILKQALEMVHDIKSTKDKMLKADSNLKKIMTICQGIKMFPGSSAGKQSACNTGDLGSIPGLGGSPREGKGYPLQYSGLENSMDCIVHGVAKSQT